MRATIVSAVSRGLSNPHTTTAGIVYAVSKVGCHIAAIWWPAHAQQFRETADVIEAGAVGWGLFMAGDAAIPPKPETKP